ncbi:polyketide cyclase/dehydrase/lipid transport protein [Nocardioides albertanoniae]|uniref:Polyketide cyclase/dehydrase/lipid transport protein n=1 Tax=Nocardioides albertanoniae TaxID=1175486 RepID=A0A543ADD3_9ACTN|nr:SRPBCC domain-containing protein [Nocardioides albertanoniae]TQL70587.1 polyketide cyclase/dehydrase/lipid transport protein [Nocardioides albertanoniae]
MTYEHPSASISIDAPIETVWRVMIETEAYAEWNPFVVRVETAQPAAVGNPIVLHVAWAGGSRSRSPERITALEPPVVGDDGVAAARMAYVYEGWPARLGLVRGVRHQRLSQRPHGPTVYETVEEFSGPLVRLAGPERVADGFRRHAHGLKKRAEADTGECRLNH